MADTNEILAAVAEIVAEEAGVEAASISTGSRFAEDLDVDSLGLLTIATQVEERFAVTLEDSVIPTLPTVGALVELVAAQKA